MAVLSPCVFAKRHLQAIEAKIKPGLPHFDFFVGLFALLVVLSQCNFTLWSKRQRNSAHMLHQLLAAGSYSKPQLICVECGTPTDSLYREYSKGNIRLTRCVSRATPNVAGSSLPACRAHADELREGG